MMHERTRRVLRRLDKLCGNGITCSRIAILGGPNAGKTTLGTALSEATGLPYFESDHLLGQLEWSDVSQYIAATWMDEGEWIIGGASVVRAVRKRLRQYEGPPADVVIHLRGAKDETTPRQDGMRRGVETMLAGICRELRKRGTEIWTYD